jgi:two-component system sensor histidine kinase ChiS
LGIAEGLNLNWEIYNDKQKQQFIKEISNNAKRLSFLVNNLLDISKFSLGKLVLDPSNFNFGDAVNEVIEECKSLYLQDRKVKIKFGNEKAISVFADRDRIIQVLRNLFVNAIKFSPKKGIINAKILLPDQNYQGENEKKFVLFKITDQGPGVPEKEIEEIFKPFIQSSITKTGAGGTGLGLSICREIIELHQGKIWAENNLDKGATFHFILPSSEEKQINNKRAATKQATLLIIDDEKSCLTAMEMLLGGTNYKLIKATGGYEGLELIEAYKDELKLVLLDLMLPDIYGLKVLQEIKRRVSSASMPVIIQTGTYDKVEIDKALGNGAVAYIRKPYQRKEVLDIIGRTLSQV